MIIIGGCYKNGVVLFVRNVVFEQKSFHSSEDAIALQILGEESKRAMKWCRWKCNLKEICFHR